MTFESYLTYEEYVSLGGTVSQDAFPVFERKAQRKLDFITFDRIRLLPSIPDVVKEVLTEYINKLSNYEEQAGSMSGVSSYSNGVESIKFDEDSQKTLDKDLVILANQWLPNYLTARSVSFDVEKYLQSENNNPE